jgi:hypothetical protein
MMDYEHFLTSLLVDLVAISVLTYALYFRRHQRRDLTLALMGVNVGLFAVSSFTASSEISVGFGIGLFALLSVIRLRSTTISQEEIGYYFVALVIGLVNGLSAGERWSVTITLNLVLLAVMFVADHPWVLRHAERHLVVLKGVPRPLDSLRGELEDRLGFAVTRLRVLEIDYANKRTRVDVRINTDRPVERRVDVRANTDRPVAPPVDVRTNTDRPMAASVTNRVETDAVEQPAAPPEEVGR